MKQGHRVEPAQSLKRCRSRFGNAIFLLRILLQFGVAHFVNSLLCFWECVLYSAENFRNFQDYSLYDASNLYSWL